MGAFSRKDITLSLGLISETVRLTGAVDKSETVQLRTVCVGEEAGTEHPATAITSVYNCEHCGVIQNRGTLKKGSPDGDGYKLVTEAEVKALRDEVGGQYKKKISLTAHPVEEVNNSTTTTDTVYYLEPQTGDGERFVLIRELVANNPHLAFVAQYTVSSRVAMYVVRVAGDALILEQREALSLVAPPVVDAEVNAPMLDMAQQLLDKLVTEFDVTAYADNYNTLLAEMVGAADVVEGDAPAPKQAPANDLMAALTAALEENAS